MPTSRYGLAAARWATRSGHWRHGTVERGVVADRGTVQSRRERRPHPDRALSSDTTIMAAAIGSLSATNVSRLDSGNAAGLTFQPASSDYSGGLSLPVGAWSWSDASIITIPPGSRLRVERVLQDHLCPAGSIWRRAAFLWRRRGLLRPGPSSMATPSPVAIHSNDSQRIGENGATFAVATNPTWFNPGTNVLLISGTSILTAPKPQAAWVFTGWSAISPCRLSGSPAVRPPAASVLDRRLDQWSLFRGCILQPARLVLPVYAPNANSSPFVFLDLCGTNKVRFYRVSVQP